MLQQRVCRDIFSTWEVWRALKRLELQSAAPRATLTPLSCSPNFPRAQYLDIRTLTHELIVNCNKGAECARQSKGLFTWSGGPRSSGVGFFCFHALGDTKQKKLTPLDRGPPLHVNRV